ncbi:hypothetical protein KJ765_01110 [Candidatus Micrarchaeota archaeon]|nr:hypothetical protein [Candidatus Micrarchaeota archaeon]
MDTKWPVALAVTLILSLAVEPFSLLVGSILRVFTEGNSSAKHLLLLFMLVLFFSFRAWAANRPFFKNARAFLRLRFLLLAWILFGFFVGIAAQLYWQSSYGASYDSYLGYVANCEQYSCWEGSYFQHIHVLKPAIYFTEKTLGFRLPLAADDGYPLYEAVPFSGSLSPLVLFLLAGIFGTTFLLAPFSRGMESSVWLAGAGFVSGIAVLDGGFFSLAGAAAFTLLLLYFGDSVPGRFRHLWPAIVFVIVIGISWFPYYVLDTKLVFREWLTAPLFLCSAYAWWRVRHARNLPFLALSALLLVSILLMGGDVVRYAFGESSAAPLALAYGLPEGASFVPSGFDELERFGWFALYAAPSSFSSVELEIALRRELKPRGYLLAEPDTGALHSASLHIVWLQSPRRFSFETASFLPSNQFDFGDSTLLDGSSRLSGPHQVLEIASLIHSNGARAIVIGKVV